MEMPSPERVRIAQELHDGIAQDLVGIGYSLDLLLSDASLSNNARTEIRATRFAVDELMSTVRAEILNLRERNSAPLHARLQIIAKKLLPECELTLRLEEVPLAEIRQNEFILIATEILRNCSTHSRATHIGINLYPVNNRTCLEVIDNGIGGAHVKDGHYGIAGIIERVHALGGSVTIESIEGTRIAILI